MKDERNEEVYLDTSTSQILEMGDSFKYKPTKETNMKCPKCNTEMDYITTECIEIGDEECKGYWECPVCVKKLVLKDVIGGLEEKGKSSVDDKFEMQHNLAYNQLCNREVEVDVGELAYLLWRQDNYYILSEDDAIVSWKKLPDDAKEFWGARAEDFNKAIEQGKVIKVKE